MAGIVMATFDPAQAAYTSYGASTPYRGIESAQIAGGSIGNVVGIPADSVGIQVVPPSAGVRSVRVQNLGLQPVWISSTVTPAPNGWHVGPGADFAIDTSSAIFVSTYPGETARIVVAEG